jgi:hypothetical protein
MHNQVPRTIGKHTGFMNLFHHPNIIMRAGCYEINPQVATQKLKKLFSDSVTAVRVP